MAGASPLLFWCRRDRWSLQGDYPTIYDDRDYSEWADENKGGGAILAYGATTIEFADTAVFK